MNGGAVAAIESHYMQDEIEAAAYEFARGVDRGEKVVVGVNRFERVRRRRPMCSRSTKHSSASRSHG